MNKKICLVMVMLVVLLCPISVSAEDTWNPEQDNATDMSETVPEAGTGVLSVEVKYTGELTPHTGDTFRLVYQVVGSDDPATITLNAEEINGYVGEIAMGIGSYEILELDYSGSNTAIQSYAVEDHFTVSENSGDTICLVIGSEGAFELSGQDGYCVHIGESDLEEDIPTDETDDNEEVEKPQEGVRETEEDVSETKHSGMLRFILLLVFGIVIAGAAFLLKRTDFIQD